MFGFLFISCYICRHHRDCVIEPIWGLYFGNGRWVSWPKLFQSSEARKATKCLLCCWSVAQFFSYVNAVICRWMWWILTSRKNLQLYFLERSARPSRGTLPEITHLTAAGRASLCEGTDGSTQWVFINRTVVTPTDACLFARTANTDGG